MPREVTSRQPVFADIDGFSLHAAVRVEAHDHKRPDQLCRYITRPALSDERVQRNADGQVELKLKTRVARGHDASGDVPLDFMQRCTEWQLCESQICECCVGGGSAVPVRASDQQSHGRPESTAAIGRRPLEGARPVKRSPKQFMSRPANARGWVMRADVPIGGRAEVLKRCGGSGRQVTETVQPQARQRVSCAPAAWWWRPAPSCARATAAHPP